jgi:hypothetical protein
MAVVRLSSIGFAARTVSGEVPKLELLWQSDELTRCMSS